MIVVLVALGILVYIFVIGPSIGWLVRGIEMGWIDTHPFTDCYIDHMVWGLIVLLVGGGSVAMGFLVKMIWGL